MITNYDRKVVIIDTLLSLNNRAGGSGRLQFMEQSIPLQFDCIIIKKPWL